MIFQVIWGEHTLRNSILLNANAPANVVAPLVQKYMALDNSKNSMTLATFLRHYNIPVSIISPEIIEV